MAVEKCYNKGCGNYSHNSRGCNIKNNCKTRVDVTRCKNAINCLTKTLYEGVITMKKEDYLSALVTLKAICLANLIKAEGQVKKGTSVSKKDQDIKKALRLATIIKRLGACRGGANATADLVSELTGLKITHEMVSGRTRHQSTADFVKDMLKLTVYIPNTTGMELAKDTPCLYITAQTFLTVSCTSKSAYYPQVDKFRLATTKEVDLFFKAVEVQIELGKSLNKSTLKAITDHSAQV